MGAALVSPELLGEIDLALDAFFIRRLGIIWAAMQTLWRAGKPVDLVTVADAFGTDGDPAYLTALVARAPSGAGAAPPAHAKTLRELMAQFAAEGRLVSKQMMKDRLAELQRQGKWTSARVGNRWYYWKK